MRTLTKRFVLDGHAALMGPYNLSVYLALFAFASDGYTTPMLTEISRKTGISDRHVKRAINQLCELGYITKTLIGRVGEQRNHYQINDPKHVGVPAIPHHEQSP